MISPEIPVELVSPLFNPATFKDRDAVHDILRRLRLDYPLSVAEVPGFDPHWIVTRHADLREIAQQDDIFRSGQRSKTLVDRATDVLVRSLAQGKATPFRSLVHMDQPEHHKHRAVCSRFFAPEGIQEMMPFLQRTAETFAEALEAHRSECDFASAIATPFALTIIMGLLGVPASEHAEMLRITRGLLRSSDPDPNGASPRLDDTHDRARNWVSVLNAFDRHFTPVIERQRRTPVAGLSSIIANGRIDGQLMSHDAMISYFMLLSTAGHDTTAATASMGMWQLAVRGDVLADLKQTPEEIPLFVEETLRWASPVQHFIRSAAKDYCLAGRKIRKGDLLYLSYLSANHDEKVFESPFTFDHNRRPNPHLSFSVGRHTCLGLHLARAALVALWTAILPRLRNLELSACPQMSQSTFVSGPKYLPIRFAIEGR
jgi:cytochrome P450